MSDVQEIRVYTRQVMIIGLGQQLTEQQTN